MKVLPSLCAAAIGIGALAACATGSGATRDPRRAYLGQAADPSAVIAAELAFARAAQTTGQWTAFRATAADGAILFVPEKTDAKAWLKGRADPAKAVQWQPHEVWSSCDGSLAITRGASQWPGGAHGDFLTVWRRQPGGGYKWIADAGQLRASALPAPDLIRTRVAPCTPKVPATRRRDPDDAAATVGQSDDGTLQYRIVQPGKDTEITATLWNGTGFDTAFVATFDGD